MMAYLAYKEADMLTKAEAIWNRAAQFRVTQAGAHPKRNSTIRLDSECKGGKHGTSSLISLLILETSQHKWLEPCLPFVQR